jgi:phosphoglycolate phosphatase-like HAD superfamily hydrolase
MLEAAARRFDLDLKACYLIGDSSTDLRTAKNAGCKALLVKTGLGGKDGRYKVQPEQVFRGLSQAASWILASEGHASGPGL